MTRTETVRVRDIAKSLGIGVESVCDYLTSGGLSGVNMSTVIAPEWCEKISTWARAGAAQDAPPAAARPRFHPQTPLVEVQGPNREDLRVKRADLSPRTVLAERPNGNEVTCITKSTAMLKPGMILRGCIEEHGYGWSYLGRLPRTRGEQQLFLP